MVSQTEFSEIINPVFPYPINTLGGLITEVSAVEIPAQEQVKPNSVPVRPAQLGPS